MTTWVNSQFPRPDFHRQLQRHYGLQKDSRPLFRPGLVFAEPATVHKELMSGMVPQPPPPDPPRGDDVSRTDLSRPSLLLSLLPHMHLRGKSMRFVAEYPEGRREVILDVPRYEFDWQNLYVLDRPMPMPEGTILHTEARFDNSADNPNNPDPRRAVTFGEQTWDEMHVGYVNFALADQDLALGAPTSKRLITVSTRSPSATAPPGG